MSRLVSVALLVCVASAKSVDAQTVAADGAKVHLISDGFKFTEGPAVDAKGSVYFTDQPNDRILRYSKSEGLETWLKPAGRSNGLFFDGEDIVACADGKNELWLIRPDKTHKVLLTGFEGRLFNGPNDIWVAGDGSYYFTDPFYRRKYWKRKFSEPELPKRVYRFVPETGKVTVVADGFKQPNGIVGDASRGVLFVADIGDNKTYQFEIGASGELINRALFCEQGSDGMTMDEDGNLYLTGKGVMVYRKNGELREKIAVPEGWTANVCIGGEDRDVLFITASDSLYTLKLKTRGLK